MEAIELKIQRKNRGSALLTTRGALLTARGQVMIFLQRQTWDNKIKTPQKIGISVSI